MHELGRAARRPSGGRRLIRSTLLAFVPPQRPCRRRSVGARGGAPMDLQQRPCQMELRVPVCARGDGLQDWLSAPGSRRQGVPTPIFLARVTGARTASRPFLAAIRREPRPSTKRCDALATPSKYGNGSFFRERGLWPHLFKIAPRLAGRRTRMNSWNGRPKSCICSSRTFSASASPCFWL